MSEKKKIAATKEEKDAIRELTFEELEQVTGGVDVNKSEIEFKVPTGKKAHHYWVYYVPENENVSAPGEFNPVEYANKAFCMYDGEE